MAIYSVLSTFPFFETVEKYENKRIEKTWKICGKSVEKPAQNGHPNRGIKQNVAFHFFFRSRGHSGTISGSSRGR